ncbi:modulation by symbiont of host I-kappaB kinase/NF-kappaB cascade [Branchiostoma belcheri]|nr:modulation by symbiont of host I-kappaB kinase/NF-kappaB cascade [Branchiostoma belcheri]
MSHIGTVSGKETSERDQPKMCAVPVKSSASPDDQALRKRIEELEGQKKEGFPPGLDSPVAVIYTSGRRALAARKTSSGFQVHGNSRMTQTFQTPMSVPEVSRESTQRGKVENVVTTDFVVANHHGLPRPKARPETRKTCDGDSRTEMLELILEVNKQWDVQYKAMKADMGQKMRDMETRHEETMRKNAELVNAEEKRQRDIDGMLMSAKKRIEAEERAKDKALLDLQQEKQRGDTLSARVTLLENQITDMMRQRGNLEAEIRRLNEALGEASSIAVLSPPALQAAERQQAPARPAQPPSQPAQPQSAEPLRTEVEVLRAQVATFREDFEMERRDRERMQGEKDTLKDEITALRMHVDNLSQQARVYEEDFRRERSDKERLQRQLGHMPQGAGEGHHYNIPPPQRHVPPPKLYRPPAPPPYREDPPAYQNYPQAHPPPTPHELQQREFDRYRQYGRLIPRQYPRTLGHDVVDDGTPRDEPLEDHAVFGVLTVFPRPSQPTAWLECYTEENPPQPR